MMMSRVRASRKVDSTFWRGRLDAARAYKESAESAVALASPGGNANPIISNIVLAAIAYADSLTAKRALLLNQQDHASAPKLLREVMGSALPAAQESRYRRILGNKDASQYGARPGTVQQAEKLLNDLESFAAWVESQL